MHVYPGKCQEDLFSQLYTSNKTESQAKLTCETNGATLPLIHTNDDKTALKHYKRLAGTGPIWAGLRTIDLQTDCTEGDCDGLLQWVDNTTFTYDANVVAQVKGWGEEPCTRFNGDRLNHQNCSQELPFVCQLTCPGETWT